MERIPRFNDFARQGAIQNGFDFIVETALRDADALVLSDVHHAKSATIIDDFFSPEKLQKLHAAGVTDVYLEIPEVMQFYVDRLAAKEINKPEFIDHYKELVIYLWLPPEKTIEKASSLADAVLAVAKMDPPIRFHMAQIENTVEQDILLENIGAQFRGLHAKVLDIAGSSVAYWLNEGYSFSNEDLDLLDSMPSYFKLGTKEYRGEFDIKEKLYRQFEGKLPIEDLERLTNVLDQLKGNFEELENTFENALVEARIDNDKALAEKIAATRANGGKAMVVHGVAHGAATHADLDEHLQNDGNTVTRINVVYDRNDLGRAGPDESDIAYFPQDDHIEFSDRNQNGIIDGGPDEIGPKGFWERLLGPDNVQYVYPSDRNGPDGP